MGVLRWRKQTHRHGESVKTDIYMLYILYSVQNTDSSHLCMPVKLSEIFRVSKKITKIWSLKIIKKREKKYYFIPKSSCLIITVLRTFWINKIIRACLSAFLKEGYNLPLLFNWPGVAGPVLQTALSLTRSLSDSYFSSNSS